MLWGSPYQTKQEQLDVVGGLIYQALEEAMKLADPQSIHRRIQEAQVLVSIGLDEEGLFHVYSTGRVTLTELVVSQNEAAVKEARTICGL